MRHQYYKRFRFEASCNLMTSYCPEFNFISKEEDILSSNETSKFPCKCESKVPSNMQIKVQPKTKQNNSSPLSLSHTTTTLTTELSV